MPQFHQYLRKQIPAEMRPHIPGEPMDGISVSDEDKALLDKPGGMIARDPENHADQWYVNEAYFVAKFETTPVD